MFGGVGSIIPCNYAEYVALTSMMIFGSLIWAWVIGSLCGVLATLNPQATAFYNTMDELNRFIRERGFDQRASIRLRDFFRSTQDFLRMESYDELLQKMSLKLRADTAYFIGERSLSQVWYLNTDSGFGGVEKDFLASVALNMQHKCFAARETISINDLLIITKGVVAYKLRMSIVGTALGTSCIVPERQQFMRDLEPASALQFVEISAIAGERLLELAQEFPQAKERLRSCGLQIALACGIRYALREHRDRQRAYTRLLGWGKPGMKDDVMELDRAKGTKNMQGLSSCTAAEHIRRTMSKRSVMLGVAGAATKKSAAATTSEAAGSLDRSLRQIKKGLNESIKRGEQASESVRGLREAHDALEERQRLIESKLDSVLDVLNRHPFFSRAASTASAVPSRPVESRASPAARANGAIPVVVASVPAPLGAGAPEVVALEARNYSALEAAEEGVAYVEDSDLAA